MSIYNLLPFPDVACREETYSFWDNGFSTDQLQSIVNYGDDQIAKFGAQAKVGKDGGSENDTIRKSTLAWIEYNQQTEWLYDKLGFIARQLNGQYFQLDVTGFSENLQYTVYNGSESGFYNWHIDKGFSNGAAPRKLSMVVQLSHPDEYEGGDLEYNVGNGEQRVAKTQGTVHVFPSWVLHRVTPITRGTRRSLVVWLCGPKLR